MDEVMVDLTREVIIAQKELVVSSVAASQSSQSPRLKLTVQ